MSFRIWWFLGISCLILEIILADKNLGGKKNGDQSATSNENHKRRMSRSGVDQMAVATSLDGHGPDIKRVSRKGVEQMMSSFKQKKINAANGTPVNLDAGTSQTTQRDGNAKRSSRSGLQQTSHGRRGHYILREDPMKSVRQVQKQPEEDLMTTDWTPVTFAPPIAGHSYPQLQLVDRRALMDYVNHNYLTALPAPQPVVLPSDQANVAAALIRASYLFAEDGYRGGENDLHNTAFRPQNPQPEFGEEFTVNNAAHSVGSNTQATFGRPSEDYTNQNEYAYATVGSGYTSQPNFGSQSSAYAAAQVTGRPEYSSAGHTKSPYTDKSYGYKTHAQGYTGYTSQPSGYATPEVVKPYRTSYSGSSDSSKQGKSLGSQQPHATYSTNTARPPLVVFTTPSPTTASHPYYSLNGVEESHSHAAGSVGRGFESSSESSSSEGSVQGGYKSAEINDAVYQAYQDHQPHYQEEEESRYKFGYRITDTGTGMEYGQAESREGAVTRGHYHVLLPDGRMQHVHYWSDDTGYHASISYD